MAGEWQGENGGRMAGGKWRENGRGKMAGEWQGKQIEKLCGKMESAKCHSLIQSNSYNTLHLTTLRIPRLTSVVHRWFHNLLIAPYCQLNMM